MKSYVRSPRYAIILPVFNSTLDNNIISIDSGIHILLVGKPLSLKNSILTTRRKESKPLKPEKRKPK